MRIYLVQHGKAKSKEQDSDRHLTEEGVEETEKIAEFIRPRGLQVESIWHSGKPRAVQTAETLALAVNVRAGLIRKDGLAPKDSIKRVIEEIERAEGDLMIVGHLPFLSRLAAKLLVGNETKEVVAFKNSGIVCLEGDEGAWRIAWMLVPDLIGGRAS